MGLLWILELWSGREGRRRRKLRRRRKKKAPFLDPGGKEEKCGCL